MHRILLILFILALPFQFTWGAAASYCAHEKGDSVSHVGHHSHMHETTAADTGSAEPLAEGGDLDCSYCHLGCAHALASETSRVSLITASVYIPSVHEPDRDRVPDPIERPNWFLAI